VLRFNSHVIFLDNQRNQCDNSQETLPDSEDESVYTTYQPGTIVLGKMAGYPW